MRVVVGLTVFAGLVGAGLVLLLRATGLFSGAPWPP
jgi:hypothetical protein